MGLIPLPRVPMLGVIAHNSHIPPKCSHVSDAEPHFLKVMEGKVAVWYDLPLTRKISRKLLQEALCVLLCKTHNVWFSLLAHIFWTKILERAADGERSVLMKNDPKGLFGFNKKSSSALRPPKARECSEVEVKEGVGVDSGECDRANFTSNVSLSRCSNPSGW
jgi:hypothetical protein